MNYFVHNNSFLKMGSSLKDGTIILSVCCVAISGGFLLYKLYSSQLQKTRVLKARNAKKLRTKLGAYKPPH